MKVSIVIPAYNTAEYLSEAIESCRSQTYKDIEIIVVNDGSKDSTDRLMQYYVKKDNRIKYISTVNQGIAKARNTGLRHATGDLIAVMDSDDICAPDRIKKAVKAIEKYGVDFIYTSYYRADSRGMVQDGITPTAKLTAEEIKFNQGVPHVTIVAKKHCFSEHPYRDELTVNDDYYLVWDWYKAGYTYKMLKDPSVIVRYHDGSVSVARKKLADEISAKIRKEIEESGIE